MVKKGLLLAFQRTFFHLGPILLFSIVLASFIKLENTKKELDRILFIHAKNVQFLLADDFHDRATNPNNISFEEESQNLLRFNKFSINNQLACVYTVIEKDNQIFVTSPTACTDNSLKKHNWQIHHFKEAPKEIITSLQTGKTQYTYYRDQFGIYRTIILPLTSPGGNTYAVCIDIPVYRYYSELLKSLLIHFILHLLIFFIILLYISLLTSNTISNLKMNSPILMSKKELKHIIDEQTNNLQRLTEKEHATNIQFKNALYSSQMGLFSFETKTGNIVNIYNNIIPDLLGYQNSQYKSNITWLFCNFGEPEKNEEYMQLISDFRLRKYNQKTIDVHAKTSTGERTWFRLYLLLQQDIDPDKDQLLILAQHIDDDKNKEKELHEQANKDALTKLYNRKYCQNFFNSQKEHSRRSDLPLAVCFIDINGLKTVNDHLGHNAGDKLLCDFANILFSCIRDCDIPARYGGDEFLLLCPRTNSENFINLWKRIMNKKEEFNTSMSREYIISFSHGYHILKNISDDMNFDEIIEYADNLMYEEKKKIKKNGLNILRN